MVPTFWQPISPPAAFLRQSSIVPFARFPDNLDHFNNEVVETGLLYMSINCSFAQGNTAGDASLFQGGSNIDAVSIMVVIGQEDTTHCPVKPSKLS